MIKTRTSEHERTIREFVIDGSGITIGEPLTGFDGVLSGNPRYVRDNDKLLKDA